MTSKPLACPACGASWVAEEIPPDIRYHYGGQTHYRRCIGLYDPLKDMNVAIACPDCKAIFDRWTWARLKAAPYAHTMH